MICSWRLALLPVLGKLPPVGFKGRLSRLGAQRAAGPPTAAPPGAGAASPPDLAALRAEMARILGTDAGEAAGSADVGPEAAVEQPAFGSAAALRRSLADSDLPFVPYETPLGPVLRRVVRHGPAHQVGRATTSAVVADPRLLSLLALDPSLAEVDLRRALFFDTETTGLGGAGSMAFLLGLGCFSDDGTFVLEQLLLDDPAVEPALLARLREVTAEAALYVSFNGKSFDWPLLQSRCIMNRQPALEARPHLDLLHVARRVHKRRLARTHLRALEEEVLGFARGEGDVAGADIPAHYAHYLRTGDAGALEGIIEHNGWDVLSMAALVGVYGEPLGTLSGLDLLGVAETLQRARELDGALSLVERVLESEPSVDALHVRAKLHKARGDRARALVDFEAIVTEVSDPKVCLELCKLYEHHAKDYQKALELLAQGTGETDLAVERRRARLHKRAKGTPP